MAEPQITDIAGCFATHLPTDGVPVPEAREGWRRALRLAREQGDAGWLADVAERQAPADAVVKAHCEALRGR